jgi:hypothetical protein
MNNNKEYELYSLRVLQTMAKERGLEYDGNEIDIIIRLKRYDSINSSKNCNKCNAVIDSKFSKCYNCYSAEKQVLPIDKSRSLESPTDKPKIVETVLPAVDKPKIVEEVLPAVAAVSQSKEQCKCISARMGAPHKKANCFLNKVINK